MLQKLGSLAFWLKSTWSTLLYIAWSSSRKMYSSWCLLLHLTAVFIISSITSFCVGRAGIAGINSILTSLGWLLWFKTWSPVYAGTIVSPFFLHAFLTLPTPKSLYYFSSFRVSFLYEDYSLILVAHSFPRLYYLVS